VKSSLVQKRPSTRYLARGHHARLAAYFRSRAMRFTVSEKAAAYFELTKPGITRMVLVTTAAGFYLGSRGAINWLQAVNTLLGTALAASGTNALNQWVERDADKLMRRTANRPLPSGKLDSTSAAVFAWSIALIGMLHLALFVNVTTALVVAASLTSYVFVYTPLKRKTWLATLIGAVPGALPILAGWTASGRPVTAAAWALFAIMFAWQMPHFYALAWIYREDYGRAGFQMLTVIDRTGARTARHTLLFAAALIPISILPSLLGVVGKFYLVGALVLGLAFFALTTRMLRKPSERIAWRIFTGSIIYLPVLLLLMVVDKT
jgi:protoheme IX farnesyltransferase